MRLHLDSPVLDQLVDYLRACLPKEGCGFLIGHGDRATRFLGVPNALESPSAFGIDPRVLFDLFRNLRASGEDLVGICHSHPSGPARPSARDLREAHYPDSFYVIVSFAGSEPEVCAWRILDGEALEAQIYASC